MSDVQPLRDTKTNNRSPVEEQIVSMIQVDVPCCAVPWVDATAQTRCPGPSIPSSSHVLSRLSVPTFHLSLAAPDVLDEAVTLGQSVQGIVGLAHGADEAAEGVDVVLAGDGAARLVNLGDGDLDGGVVLGLDDAVGGRALAGDVAV